jgi:hypothetical protein
MRQKDALLLEALEAFFMRYRRLEGSLQCCIESVLELGRIRLCGIIEAFPRNILAAASMMSSRMAIVTRKETKPSCPSSGPLHWKKTVRPVLALCQV